MPELDKLNYYSFDGAKRLQRRIEKYWADRGYTVTTRLEEYGEFYTMFLVKSDMVDGWPKDYHRKKEENV